MVPGLFLVSATSRVLYLFVHAFEERGACLYGVCSLTCMQYAPLELAARRKQFAVRMHVRAYCISAFNYLAGASALRGRLLAKLGVLFIRKKPVTSNQL